MNLLRPELGTDADGTLTSAAVLQEPPSSPAGVPAILRPHRIAIGLYDDNGEGLVRTASPVWGAMLALAGARTMLVNV